MSRIGDGGRPDNTFPRNGYEWALVVIGLGWVLFIAGLSMWWAWHVVA